MFEEVHREYMVISWKPPLDSGGVDVSNYIVEKRDVNRDIWTTVTAATTKTICKVGTCLLEVFKGPKRLIFHSGCKLVEIKHINMFFLQIPKLTEGREYIMRISAENMYGISDPLESEEMRAKDLLSTFHSHTSKILLLFHISAAIN